MRTEINKFRITWASNEDKMFEGISAEEGNPIAERVAKLQQMKSEGKTEGKLEQTNDLRMASMDFVSLDAAKEWQSFIIELANRYNKKIISTSIEVYETDFVKQ
jgi:hypothetical protein